MTYKQYLINDTEMHLWGFQLSNHLTHETESLLRNDGQYFIFEGTQLDAMSKAEHFCFKFKRKYCDAIPIKSLGNPNIVRIEINIEKKITYTEEFRK